jgi:Cu-Zn family superoxide dismutase
MIRPGAIRPTALALCLAFLAGCGGAPQEQAPETGAADAAPGRTATATLSPASGSSVTGTVTFTEQADGVHVFAMISGLSPGPHGFHIHETGDCSAPDATSAGAHFNPTGAGHGAPGAGEHHAGDMGNITADEGGNANYEQVLPALSLADGPNSIIGRAVIVHADPDDMTTQPTGNAGARLACGVIVAGTH